MSIERANFNMPERMSDQDLPQRYMQPGALTHAGQIDRRHEGQHVVRVRDMQRDAIERAAKQAQQEFELEAWLECRGRALSEAKYKLLRNHKESQFLAQDDPIMQGQYHLLDAEYFQELRIRFNDWQ